VPLYDYQCRSCNEVTEVRHGFKETFEGSCPKCGGEMARVFNPAGIVFKGSGFYVTDSRKGGEAAKETAKSESSPPPAAPKSESAA
jgi:putative FmdB family regulatory protein